MVSAEKRAALAWQRRSAVNGSVAPRVANARSHVRMVSVETHVTLARPIRSAVLENVAIQALARQIVTLFTTIITKLHIKLVQRIVSLGEPS